MWSLASRLAERAHVWRLAGMFPNEKRTRAYGRVLPIASAFYLFEGATLPNGPYRGNSRLPSSDAPPGATVRSTNSRPAMQLTKNHWQPD
ncbi:hypothetical protein SAMN04488061_0366 [Filomicrobium insigne]|uniref:Uncharacterized protein n=1 Tax=Filomicrobium insigne TaxID=418854 RepID=A0A1H0H2T5_9HYPH|nr:hypothetical protein SAMN04488061_0366 [Filomicrobium insigne]